MLNRRQMSGSVGLLGAALGATAAASPASAQTAPPAGAPQQPIIGNSSLERILTAKKLRVAGIAAEEPYFKKDLRTGQWSGFCIAMARDIAQNLGVELEIVESTWGNSVLDLQSNRIDISFGLNPTPRRALVVDFPPALFYNTSSFIGRRGFRVETWDELNRPEVRIAVDIGTSREVIVRRYASRAQITGYRTSPEGLLAVLSGRADCFVCTVFLGLAARKQNPNLGDFFIPRPHVQVVTTAAIQYDRDGRFRQFFSAWRDFHRGLGQMREWIVNGMAEIGIPESDLPREMQF